MITRKKLAINDKKKGMQRRLFNTCNYNHAPYFPKDYLFFFVYFSLSMMDEIQLINVKKTTSTF